MGLKNGDLKSGVVLKRGFTVYCSGHEINKISTRSAYNGVW